MEFGFEPVCDQVRASQAISTCRNSLTCSNLVADRFAAGLRQIPLRYPGRRQVQSWSQTGPKLVADLLARAGSMLDDWPNSSSLQICDQLRTCLRPDSVMEFGCK